EAERLAREAAEAEAKAAAEQPLTSPEIVASEPVSEAQPEQVAEAGIVESVQQPSEPSTEQEALPQEQPTAAVEPQAQPEQQPLEAIEPQEQPDSNEEAPQQAPREPEGSEPDTREKPQS